MLGALQLKKKWICISFTEILMQTSILKFLSKVYQRWIKQLKIPFLQLNNDPKQISLKVLIFYKKIALKLLISKVIVSI